MLNQKTQPSQRLGEGRTYFYLKQVRTRGIFPKTVSPEQQNWRSFKLSFHMHFPKGLVCMLSHIQLFATPWTISRQAPLSMGFPRQEYWHGFPFPTPEDFPDPEIEPASLMSSALAGRFFTTSTSWEAH